MSNKSNGNQFERELAKNLSDYGAWVHLLQQNSSGQPADLIVATPSYCTLIDCKDISGKGGFRLSRVEENQRLAMSRFTDRIGNFCWFAVRFSDGAIYLQPAHYMFQDIDSGRASIPEQEIRDGWFPLGMFKEVEL